MGSDVYLRASYAPTDTIRCLKRSSFCMVIIADIDVKWSVVLILLRSKTEKKKSTTVIKQI